MTLFNVINAGIAVPTNTITILDNDSGDPEILWTPLNCFCECTCGAAHVSVAEFNGSIWAGAPNSPVTINTMADQAPDKESTVMGEFADKERRQRKGVRPRS